MKFILNLIIVIPMLFCFNVCGAEYFVPETNVTPTIDGILTSGEWDDAFSLQIEYPAITQSPYNGAYPPNVGHPSDSADLSADVYIKWNENYIFAAYHVKDQSIYWSNDLPNTQISVSDGVQFSIIPYNIDGAVTEPGGGAVQFDLVVDTNSGAGAQWYNRVGGTAMISEIDGSELSDGYIIEISVPFSGLEIEPAYGQQHGIGLVLLDTDNGSDWNALLADFSNDGEWDTFKSEASNVMTLVSSDGCGTQPMDVSDLDKNCKVDLFDFIVIASNWMECTAPECY
jgi:hypothetical protein